MLRGVWDAIVGLSGIVFIVVLVGFLLLLFLGIPWLVGWAFHYLLHFVRNEPEITDFWVRWFTGVAVGFIGYCFHSSKD